MYLIISHDVDWSRRGPDIKHILARRNRFDEEIIRLVLERDQPVLWCTRLDGD